jgi:hypothetical protein
MHVFFSFFFLAELEIELMALHILASTLPVSHAPRRPGIFYSTFPALALESTTSSWDSVLLLKSGI